MKQLSYLPFSNETITIYNKYIYNDLKGRPITRWRRTVLPNCSKSTRQDLITNGSFILSQSKLTATIPLFQEYINTYDYMKIPNDEMDNYFTVNDGDLIVLKQVNDEVDDFMAVEELQAKYGSIAFFIGSVSENLGENYPLQHIKAVSK